MTEWNGLLKATQIIDAMIPKHCLSDWRSSLSLPQDAKFITSLQQLFCKDQELIFFSSFYNLSNDSQCRVYQFVSQACPYHRGGVGECAAWS